MKSKPVTSNSSTDVVDAKTINKNDKSMLAAMFPVLGISNNEQITLNSEEEEENEGKTSIRGEHKNADEKEIDDIMNTFESLAPSKQKYIYNVYQHLIYS